MDNDVNLDFSLEVRNGSVAVDKVVECGGVGEVLQSENTWTAANSFELKDPE